MPNEDTGREIDWTQLVKRAQGKDAKEPEVVYTFSNGRKFKNTDQDGGGVYGDAAVPD